MVYRNEGIFSPWDSFKVCWKGQFYTTTFQDIKKKNRKLLVGTESYSQHP